MEMRLRNNVKGNCIAFKLGRFEDKPSNSKESAESKESNVYKIPIMRTGKYLKQGEIEDFEFDITEEDIDIAIANAKRRGLDLVIDCDHRMPFIGGESMGRVPVDTLFKEKAPENDDIILYGKGYLTKEGQDKVDNEKYLYISPVLVFNHRNMKEEGADHRGKNLGLYIWNLSLVNVPFFAMPKVAKFSLDYGKNSAEFFYLGKEFSEMRKEDLISEARARLVNDFKSAGASEEDANAMADSFLDWLFSLVDELWGKNGEEDEKEKEKEDSIVTQNNNRIMPMNNVVDIKKFANDIGLNIKNPTYNDLVNHCRTQESIVNKFNADIARQKRERREAELKALHDEFKANQRAGRHGNMHDELKKLFDDGINRDEPDISIYRNFVSKINPVSMVSSPDVVTEEVRRFSNRSLDDKAQKVDKFTNDFYKKHGRFPTFDEASEFMHELNRQRD